MAVAGGERFGELAADQLGVAFAVGERQAARQQLEGGDPEAEDVGGHSHRFTPQQFGCGVGGGGHHGVVDVCGGQGDTEVGEVGGSLFVEQQVGGANVAVDDTFAVCFLEGAADVAEQVDGGSSGERATGSDGVFDASSPQQSHHQVRRPRLSPVVVERNHMRVFDGGHRLGFHLEAADELRSVRQLRSDDLDRHLAADTRLNSAVDNGVSALSDPLPELVATQLPRGACQ
jgi:hypothetical protein